MKYRTRRFLRQLKGGLLYVGMVFLVGMGVLALETWLLMMLIGIVHGNWLHNMPTIGFWDAVPIAFFIAAFLGSVIRYAVRDAKKDN